MRATLCFAIISAIAFMSDTRSACADTIEITFASGRIQSVELEESAKEVKDIKLKEVSSLPLPEKVREFINSMKQGQQPAQNEQQPATKKTGPSFKWAPPISE